MEECFVLVGLGNPGIAYEYTRHNLGYLALEAFASQCALTFRRVKPVYGLVAQGHIQGKNVFLLKPETYMNSSGEAVKAFLAYYRLLPSSLCVVCDDIYLPLGKIKMRASGGDGGHNGLKSISSHLGIQSYARLRIGVGEPGGEQDLADHVLSSFTLEEQQQIPPVLQRVSDALLCWMGEGIVAAMQKANACQEQRRGDEDGQQNESI
ncbi:MAG: aminoacyl-tRNA hydrolase [Chlamydiae bacterium]|nr:aminoacyl-tRNA hydrolase [Chlamydiota bacterium]